MTWKQDHANEAERMADHPLVHEVAEEFAQNMGFKLEGLPRYGMYKVIYHTAQVVLARARGFEPDLLLMDDEADVVRALSRDRGRRAAAARAWCYTRERNRIAEAEAPAAGPLTLRIRRA